MSSTPLAEETVWFEKHAYEDAEQRFHLVTFQACTGSSGSLTSLADDIARVRQHIKNSLQCPNENPVNTIDVANDDLLSLSQRMKYLESENHKSNLVVEKLQKQIKQLEDRIEALEKEKSSSSSKEQNTKDNVLSNASIVASSTPVKKDDDDDDVDLFGSGNEDEEEKEKLKQERLKAYEEKKSKKPTLIAKSNVILDVKPWDDETDMKEMERQVRNIQFDGLIWGASKLVPLAYGIHKLQISCVVEDEKVSVDLLQEQIEGLEDLVQSMDIAAFNKV